MNSFPSKCIFTFDSLVIFMYVTRNFSENKLTKYKIFPRISADCIRKTFLLLNGISRRRETFHFHPELRKGGEKQFHDAERGKTIKKRFEGDARCILTDCAQFTQLG